MRGKGKKPINDLEYVLTNTTFNDQLVLSLSGRPTLSVDGAEAPVPQSSPVLFKAGRNYTVCRIHTLNGQGARPALQLTKRHRQLDVWQRMPPQANYVCKRVQRQRALSFADVLVKLELGPRPAGECLLGKAL